MTQVRPQLVGMFPALLALGLAADCGAAESDAQPVPTAEAIAQMVQKEPISRTTWPVWRKRYLDWFYDRTKRTEKFEEQLQAFVRQEAEANQHTLPAYLGDDAVAWYVYGTVLVREKKPASQIDNLTRAEAAFRRSIALDAKFAPPHGGLAGALVLRTMGAAAIVTNDERQSLLRQASAEIEKSASLDSRTRPAFLRGLLACAQQDFVKAETCFRQAMDDYPESEHIAGWFAQAVLAQMSRNGKWSDATAPLVKRFPEEGGLHVFHAAALMSDGDAQAAAEQLELARKAKTSPEELLGAEGVKSIERVAKLMSPSFRQGLEEFKAQRFAAAERLFRQALRERPDECEYARAVAHAALSRDAPNAREETAREIEGFCRRFPQDGELEVLHAVALARVDRAAEAVAALRKAEQLGADPAKIVGAETVEQIHEMSRPGLLARFLWIMAYAAAAYAGVILLMAGAGVVLAALTRGQATPVAGPLVTAEELYGGQSLLARVYVLALLASLILFYVSIPFVVAGLAALTLGALYAIFLLRRIPVRLVVIIAIIGFSMVVAVLKSIFARGGAMKFGIEKTDGECPRFYAALREVAQKVETRPVDEVYLGPGAEVSVRQEGRGPFGIFGVKRRLLTVGLATLHHLNVGELKSILAHEYAHFSHRDTFYSRFIHQVTLSIAHALAGMGAAGGRLNYVNPFYWFFVLYYRAYGLLAAGFSRSREFLADRVAASLYGRQVFLTALTKVATDGTLFEATASQNISRMMAEGKAFINIYEAFAAYRDEQLSDEERHKLYGQFLDQKASVFSSHPTFRERVAAVASFPQTVHPEETPALGLFDNVEELDRELTDFLTGYVHVTEQWHAQAAQAP